MKLIQYLTIFALPGLQFFISPIEALSDLQVTPDDHANISTPAKNDHKHVKRLLPQLGAGFTGSENLQVIIGWKDACTLAVAALDQVRIFPYG
jgi:hypothetical protein